MTGTYAVVWRAPGGVPATGKVSLGERALVLAGSSAGAGVIRERIPYRDIAGVRIGRAVEEQLNGHRTVLLDRVSAPALALAVFEEPGALLELADLLAELAGEARRGLTRVVVIVPLRRGAYERALRLIDEGPPFDPGSLRIERHEVFASEQEIVFLFEGKDIQGAVEQLARSPALWRAAVAWKDVIAGKPRLAERRFAWEKGDGRLAGLPIAVGEEER